MIELLVAYLLYEGNAQWEWWAIFATLLALKVWHLRQAARRLAEVNFVIHKIITEARKDDNIH
jgi:hypothetical protein